MTGLQQLARLDLEYRRALHPTMPAHAIVRTVFSDKTANELTRAIVRTFQVYGHFATRLQSTGTYREDIKQFVASQQRKGMPDVFAVVNGRAVFVEIKVGRDCLSNDQKQTIADLQKAGASVFVARDFQTFYEYFLATFPAPFSYAPRQLTYCSALVCSACLWP